MFHIDVSLHVINPIETFGAIRTMVHGSPHVTFADVAAQTGAVVRHERTKRATEHPAVSTHLLFYDQPFPWMEHIVIDSLYNIWL